MHLSQILQVPKEIWTTTTSYYTSNDLVYITCKLLCNTNGSHPKIVHMNDIDTIKFHVHSLLLNFTVDFIIDGITLGIISHS